MAGPFNRASDTLAWLAQHTPDVAIIDIHLRDGSSADLAGVLRQRGVPFIVFSGDKRDGRSPEAFEGGRWLSKPVGTRQLLDTLAGLVPTPPCRKAQTSAAASACAL